MAYGLEYRSEWMMQNDTDTVRVSIFDTDLITDDIPVVINMVPSGNPLTISIIDNDKDKYKAIKSRQAKIEVLTSNEVGFETFADASDNRYRVEVRLNPEGDNTPLLLGFLSLADNQEDFLPDPNVLVLTATDHLGMIKDIPMTMPSGAVPSGKSKMIDYLSWCLRKTGLDLEIYVVNNLRHGSGELTNAATFSSAGNYFVTNSLLTNFFYPGQLITISGTASNDGSFEVESVDNTGVVTQVTLTTAITVGEVAAGASFSDDTSSEYFYDHYLDAKTFEAEIGACEDCYQVIEKILGFDCFVTQYAGRWWIFRIDEWDTNDIYVTRYGYDGTFVSFEAGTTYNKSIGRGESLSPVLADFLLMADRPHGMDKLTFNYEYPSEIPCNSDYSKGDYISDLSEETIDNQTYYPKKYYLDCWNFWEQATPADGNYQDTPSFGEAYIKKVFNQYSYEADRYIVMTYPTYPNPNVIVSEPIEIGIGDKFDFGFTFRFSTDIDNGMLNNAHSQIRLEGTDGSIYFLGADGIWYLSDSNWVANYKFLSTSVDTDTEDVSDWMTYEISDIDRVPVDGSIYILINWGNYSDLASRELHIKDINFTYHPFINGSNTKYTGQYQKITRFPNSYLGRIDDTVSISDSPKPLLKGGIFRQISTYVFKLAERWFPYNVFGLTLPQDGNDYAHPYGEVQIRSVFNQYRNANRIFSGSVSGLTEDWPDLIHKYSLTDVNPNTNDRFFMLASFEQNWKSGYFSGTWIEVYKAPGKSYTEDREFKYISQ